MEILKCKNVFFYTSPNSWIGGAINISHVNDGSGAKQFLSDGTTQSRTSGWLGAGSNTRPGPPGGWAPEQHVPGPPGQNNGSFQQQQNNSWAQQQADNQRMQAEAWLSRRSKPLVLRCSNTKDGNKNGINSIQTNRCQIWVFWKKCIAVKSFKT